MKSIRISPRARRFCALVTLFTFVLQFFPPLLPGGMATAEAAEAADGGAAGSASYYQQEVEKFGKGRDQVGPNGVMSYSYPMGSVAASYNSEGGWSVGGHSRIARSTKWGVPAYTDADIFTLNGEELVKAGESPGSPACEAGDAGWLYHTENESYQRILYCNPGAAGSYWKIYNQDGSWARYGSTPDSRIEAVDKPAEQPRAWAIAETQDIGEFNTTRYSYTEDSANGAYYLDTIVSGKTAASNDGYAATLLYYEDRPDQRVSFRSGAKVQAAKRVKTVVNALGCTLEGVCDFDDIVGTSHIVNAYRIGWTQSAQTDQSIITTITPYGHDTEIDDVISDPNPDDPGDLTGGTTLPATTFDYLAYEGGFETTNEPWTGDTTYALRYTTPEETPDCNDISDSLVACYPFNGNANDESPNGMNHGIVNGATLTADRSGNPNSAYYFDGINNYIKILSSSSLNISDAITLMAWIKPNAEGAYHRPILEYHKDGSICGVHVWQHNTFDKPYANFVANTMTPHPVQGPAGQFIADNWHSIAAVYDGTYGYLYVDGDEVTKKSIGNFSLLTSSYDLYIGKRPPNGCSNPNTFFHGVIDDIRIYNRALTEAEIQQLAAVGGTVTEADLMDVNSDGLPDRVSKSSDLALAVRLNNGSSFDEADTLPLPQGDQGNAVRSTGGSTHYDLIDMNSDGRADRVKKDTTGDTLFVYLSTIGTTPDGDYIYFPDTPADWTNDSTTAGIRTIVTTATFSGTTSELIDMNGDGLPDRINNSGSDLQVYFNTGSGFASTPQTWGGPGRHTTESPAEDTITEADFMDVNGDGLPDRVAKGAGIYELAVWLNTGTGFGAEQTWIFPDGNDQFYGPRSSNANGTHHDLMDINGDGVIDRISKFKGAQSITVYPGKQEAKSDILIGKVTNALGGAIEYTYAPIPKTIGFYGDETNPYYKPKHVVVDTVTTDDGLNTPDSRETSTYEYFGGTYNNQTREDYGFRTIKITHADDTQIERHYYQDEDNGLYAGRLKKEVVRGPDNGVVRYVYDYTFYTYTNLAATYPNYGYNITQQRPGAGPDLTVRSVKLDTVHTYLVDGTTWFDLEDVTILSGWEQSRMTYAYNDYGLVTDEIDYGSVPKTSVGSSSMNDLGNDRVDIRTTYQEDLTTWQFLPQTAATYAHQLDGSLVPAGATTYTYDMSTGFLTDIDVDKGGGSIANTHRTPDAYGNVKTITDPNSYTSVMTYEERYRAYPVKVDAPPVNGISFASVTCYDALMRPWKTIGPKGDHSAGTADGVCMAAANDCGNADVACRFYDAFGRVAQVIGPDDSPSAPTISTAYNQDGTAPSSVIIDVKDGPLSRVYVDGFGNTAQTKTRSVPNGEGYTQWRTVDVWSYVEGTQRVAATSEIYLSLLTNFTRPETAQDSVLSGRSVASTRSFLGDGEGRVTETTNFQGDTATVTRKHFTTTTVDEEHNQTVAILDPVNQQQIVQECEGGSCLYAVTTYRTAFDREQIIDAEGRVTTRTFNRAGELLSLDDPDLGVWPTYLYDLNGNLLSVTDAKGQTTGYSYDSHNRLTRVNYPAGTDTAYYYDGDDNADGTIDAGREGLKGYRTYVTETSGSTTWNYDIRGNISQETKTIGGKTATTGFRYNAYQLTGILYPGDSEWTEYSFNSDREVTGLTAPGQPIASDITYNPLGKMTHIGFGNGAATDYTYSPASGNFRLQEILVTGMLGSLPNQPLMQRAYTYDKVGNILSIDDLLDSQYDQNFSYDELYRLTGQTNANFIGGYESFSYSPAGNLLSKNGQTYSYYEGTHQVENDGVHAYTYDANGNRVAKDGLTYTYDYDNRLTGLSSGERFEYDFAGRRVKKTEGPITTYYFNEYYEEEEELLPPETPAPIAPAGTISVAAPEYTWTEVADAAEYHLWVDGPSGTAINTWYAAADICVDGMCAVTPSTALEAGKHYWWVQAWNAAGTSPWSARTTFWTCLGQLPDQVNPTSPPFRSLADSSPTFVWPVSLCAQEYVLQVDGASGTVISALYAADTICDAGTCSVTPAVTLDDGLYRWWAQARNGTGGVWSARMEFMVGGLVPPAQVTLLSPLDTVVATATSSYTWTPDPYAQEYLLWVGQPNISGTTDLVYSIWYGVSVCQSGQCTVAPAQALDDGDYRWWVRPWNFVGYGPWGVRGEFAVSVAQGAGAASPETMRDALTAGSVAAELQRTDESAAIASDIVTIEGQTLTINVADSPQLNYGVGDFTVLVQVRMGTNAETHEPVLDVTWDGIAEAIDARAGVLSAQDDTTLIAAGVRDGDTLLLYLDGQLQAQKTIGEKAVDRLSVDINLSAPAHTATIEHVHLFDHALTADEINQERRPGSAGIENAAASPADIPQEEPESIPPVDKDGPGEILSREDDPGAPLPLGDGPVTAIKYYYLNGLRVSEQRDGVWTWTHSDHLHSATVITDSAGEQIRHLTYRAFGEEVENTGPGREPKYTYTGKEADATGLLYYGARYYDPVLAQFITADTVYDAGPQGLNRYSYALNNPIIYRDPTGHFITGPNDENDPGAYGSITGSQQQFADGTATVHDGETGEFNLPLSAFDAGGYVGFPADPRIHTSPYATPTGTFDPVGDIETAVSNFGNELCREAETGGWQQMWLNAQVGSGDYLVSEFLSTTSFLDPSRGLISGVQAPLLTAGYKRYMGFVAGTLFGGRQAQRTSAAYQVGKYGMAIIVFLASTEAEAASSEQTSYRDILTPDELDDFTQLRQQYPDWMPDLDAPAQVRTHSEVKAARRQVRGRGHHREPLAFGGNPNPSQGLVKTGDTRKVKNLTHLEVTNFWNRVLRRIRNTKE